MTDPGPQHYRPPASGRCKSFRIQVNQDAQQFIDALNCHSGGKFPDSMMDVSDVIVVYSVNHAWHIVADREADVAVCVFYAWDMKNQFENAFGDEQLPDIEFAANYAYGETRYGRKAISSAMQQFVQNYSDLVTG